MSKKILWSDLLGLKDLVAGQNVALLTAVVEIAKTHDAHFKANKEDRDYLIGTLDILTKNTEEIKLRSDEINKIVTKLLQGKNGPDTKVIIASIAKPMFMKKNIVRTKDQISYLSIMADLQKHGEVIATTGGSLIIELTTRLKLQCDVIDDIVNTTEDYLNQTGGTDE